MVFSSYLFIFGFFPIFFLIYYALRPGLRNLFILLASLTFYYIGDHAGLVALVGAIVVNYTVGLLMGPAKDPTHPTAGRRVLLTAGLVINLGVLVWYKYIGLLTTTIDALAGALGAPGMVPLVTAALPLGISFFVFQGMSYLIDVFRGTIEPTRSIIVFGAYKSLFPQLIAGPIVRYRDIAGALDHRETDIDQIKDGVVRFMTGFVKKVLLADTFAFASDSIFALPSADLSTGTAWVGTLAYTLQIYFDFSAYSDMAIGMGLMMGFRFPENFAYPYSSRSIQEFWRRWHISLSSWFRDYVYVPLGGNRRGPVRTYVNLVVVFFLTGLWHGASWTFVVWGLWHGAFMVIERRTKFTERGLWSPLRRVYTLAVVIVGWVLFRAEGFDKAWRMLGLLVGVGEQGTRAVGEFVDPWLLSLAAVGAVLAMPVLPWLRRHVPTRLRIVAGVVVLVVTFGFASAKVLAGAYSPFLYFRF